MIFKIYSVYDEKAEAYMPPFYQSNENMAKRTFTDACDQEDHPFRKNPADYYLCDLGTFDDMTGLVSAHSQPVRILSASEIVEMLSALNEVRDFRPNYSETDLKDLEDHLNGK